MAKMTIFDALAEMKLLEKKIIQIQTGAKVAIGTIRIKGKDTDVNGLSVEDVGNNAKAYYNKYRSYVNTLNKIRGLVYDSNATTPIEIAGVKYPSKAIAITRYNNIENEKSFYVSLRNTLEQLSTQVKRSNDKNCDRERATRIVDPNGSISDPDVLDSMIKAYMSSVEVELVDPLGFYGADKKIDQIIAEIDEFRANYHRELNRSNLLTEIDVPDDDATQEYLK